MAVPVTRRLVERFGLGLSGRQSPTSEDSPESQESGSQPGAPSDMQPEPPSQMSAVDVDADEPRGDRPSSREATDEVERRADELRVTTELRHEALRRESEAEAARITADARRQERELLEEAELEAARILVAAGQESARYENAVEQERVALEERRTRLDSLAVVQKAERRAEELVAAAERQCESLVREAEAEAERKAASITADARRKARERVEEAELEAKGIVVETGKERARLLTELAQERSLLAETRTRLDSLTAIEEAAHAAEELLVAAERRRDELWGETEAEALRKAAEITEGASRQVQEQLEEARLEAKGIVDAANRERARVNELAQERSDLEERWTKLSSFLADVLEEVERMPTASDAPAELQDLDEALVARASTGAD